MEKRAAGYEHVLVGSRVFWSQVQGDPLCDGGCGQTTGSPTGMCFQCQCEAHADGWYDMDTGYARVR